ncbi:hypothetical protein CHARACLAT_018310 [Characodon lateralis]|uniref:Uncharacterized protein n=1 Tax=Characodon lateralis TaxID=208331 RepID=A0ABU7DAS1_9TELE|nr:hypothetical protein [Characodon lateralis]
MRENENQESAEWLKNYQMRSQAMKKTVVLHAKLLDPHSSLKDVCNENRLHHQEADLQRMRDYMKELRDMKARVRERPYLFEQVKQENAKAHAEQTYRRKLQKAGIKEQFVEETGESFRFDYAASYTSSHGSENKIQSREENVDDGEKIEDVEEKSVKSKGEEMP